MCESHKTFIFNALRFIFVAKSLFNFCLQTASYSTKIATSYELDVKGW